MSQNNFPSASVCCIKLTLLLFLMSHFHVCGNMLSSRRRIWLAADWYMWLLMLPPFTFIEGKVWFGFHISKVPMLSPTETTIQRQAAIQSCQKHYAISGSHAWTCHEWNMNHGPAHECMYRKVQKWFHDFLHCMFFYKFGSSTVHRLKLKQSELTHSNLFFLSHSLPPLHLCDVQKTSTATDPSFLWNRDRIFTLNIHIDICQLLYNWTQ